MADDYVDLGDFFPPQRPHKKIEDLGPHALKLAAYLKEKGVKKFHTIGSQGEWLYVTNMTEEENKETLKMLTAADRGWYMRSKYAFKPGTLEKYPDWAVRFYFKVEMYLRVAKRAILKFFKKS